MNAQRSEQQERISRSMKAWWRRRKYEEACRRIECMDGDGHLSDPLMPMFGTPHTQWRRWFAWRPIETADAGWVWLRHIEFRLIVKHEYLFGGGDTWFQYRCTAA